MTQDIFSLSIRCILHVKGHRCSTEESTPLLPEVTDDFDDFSSSDDSDSDAPFRSFSPVTSDDEYYTSSDISLDSDGSGDDKEDSHVDGNDFQSCSKDRLFILRLKLDTLKVKE